MDQTQVDVPSTCTTKDVPSNVLRQRSQAVKTLILCEWGYKRILRREKGDTKEFRRLVLCSFGKGRRETQKEFRRYYLANGVYRDWVTLVKTIHMPQGEKIKLFAKCQELARKDVDRAFSVLKSRFAIICGPSRNWHINTYNGNVDVDYDQIDKKILNIDISHGAPPNFSTYLQTRRYMHTRGIHQQLQVDLVKYIWACNGLYFVAYKCYFDFSS
ncbi:hypothetical protein HKD37_04G010506 [Glycine soja]